MTAAPPGAGAVLGVEDLTVEYQTSRGMVRAVTDVSLAVCDGEPIRALL